MSAASEGSGHSAANWRLIAIMIAAASIVILIAANAHLVYVAFVSQPDCVTHTKAVGEKGTYRAARSAC
jgi:hypothetical protein